LKQKATLAMRLFLSNYKERSIRHNNNPESSGPSDEPLILLWLSAMTLILVGLCPFAVPKSKINQKYTINAIITQ
jgi:hypothetical protein